MPLYDFTPLEWQELFEKIDFTDKELIVIELKRRGWRNIDIAEEMQHRIGHEVSERTIIRWHKAILRKIFKII